MTPLHKQSNDEADQLSWWPCSHRRNPAPSGQNRLDPMPCILPGTLAHPNASECILKTLTGSRQYLNLFQLSSFMHREQNKMASKSVIDKTAPFLKPTDCEDHDFICFPASLFVLAPVFCGVFDNLKWLWEERGVDVIALLSTTYIYCWKWILDEAGDIKGSGIKAPLISYPLFLETWTFLLHRASVLPRVSSPESSKKKGGGGWRGRDGESKHL